VDSNVLLLPDDDKGRIIGADAATIVFFFLFVVGNVDEVNDWTTMTAYSNPNSSSSMTDVDGPVVCFRLFILLLDLEILILDLEILILIGLRYIAY